MDTFLAELTNLGAIVRTLILFVVTFFIARVINRYLSYRSVKGIRRRINPTATLYLALGLSPLSMCKIGVVITPLQPGHQREDVCNLRQPQG
jgi:hypothetical protein